MNKFISNLVANKFSFTALLFIAVFAMMGIGMGDAFLIESAPKGGATYGLACAFPFICLLIGISVFLTEYELAAAKATTVKEEKKVSVEAKQLSTSKETSRVAVKESAPPVPQLLEVA